MTRRSAGVPPAFRTIAGVPPAFRTIAGGTPALPAWLAPLLLLGAGALHAADPIALSGRAMGTAWTVKFVQLAPPLDSAWIAREVADRLEQLEQVFSTYRIQSELSRFNASESTAWIPVAPEMAHVAAESRRISELTDGAFDVTVYPLVQLWGFGSQRRSGSLPTAGEIASARALVDWRQLEVRLDPPALCKARPRITADFSSMAKGFAADAIGELLTRLGAPNHLVQIGGDIKSGGLTGENTGWRAAIEQPLDDVRAIACVVNLTGSALSTSGNYRNFFHVGRRRYGHIIDPRTGEPPLQDLAAVSVVHALCATSSALATALFVLGTERGFALAREQKLACVFFIRRGGEFQQMRTPEFEALVR